MYSSEHVFSVTQTRAEIPKSDKILFAFRTLNVKIQNGSRYLFVQQFVLLHIQLRNRVSNTSTCHRSGICDTTPLSISVLKTFTLNDPCLTVLTYLLFKHRRT